MQNIIAKRQTDRAFPKAELDCIWYVSADSTYDIPRRAEPFSRRLIVIRTLSGGGIVTLQDGNSLVCRSDGICLVWESHIRRYRTEETSWRFYWFECTMPEAFSVREGMTEQQVNAMEAAYLQNCFESFGTPSRCMMAEALFNFLLNQWLLQFDESNSDEEILVILERGRRERLSIPQMAQQARMSERSFRDAVHRAAGMSPKEFLLKGEMDAAIELLQTTEMSVSQIAAHLLYSSPLYFSRVFKNYYGMSPRQVREKLKGTQGAAPIEKDRH